MEFSCSDEAAHIRLKIKSQRPTFLGRNHGNGRNWKLKSKNTRSLYILLPFKCTVYWICSLHHDVVPLEFQVPVEKAMQAYYVMSGKRRKNVEWIFPKGPKQKGNWECGYFCMITAKEIIDTLQIDDFEEVYDSNKPYTMEDLNKVRQEWFKEFVQQTRIHKDFHLLPNEAF